MLAIRLSPPEKRGRCVGHHRRPRDKRRSKRAQVGAQTRNRIRHRQWPTLLVVLMINETRCLISGSDQMTDGIHDLSHRFPRSMYALAVVVGLVLGHLFWI